MYSSGRFTAETERVLRESGWFPERTVNEEILDSWLVVDWNPPNIPALGYSKIFPAAWRTLKEFGGLTINLSGNGSSKSKEPFSINPLLVVESSPFNYDWHIEEWSLGETLFPIGMVRVQGTPDNRMAPHPMDFAIAMNTNGRVFLLGCSTLLAGRNMDEALENLILGIDLGEEIDDSQNNDGGGTCRKIMERIAKTKIFISLEKEQLAD